MAATLTGALFPGPAAVIVWGILSFVLLPCALVASPPLFVNVPAFDEIGVKYLYEDVVKKEGVR